MYLFFYLYLSIDQSVFLPVCLSIYLSIYLSISQSDYQSICLSTSLSTYLSINMSIYLSIYLFLTRYLFLCIFIFFSTISIAFISISTFPREISSCGELLGEGESFTYYGVSRDYDYVQDCMDVALENEIFSYGTCYCSDNRGKL